MTGADDTFKADTVTGYCRVDLLSVTYLLHFAYKPILFSWGVEASRCSLGLEETASYFVHSKITFSFLAKLSVRL